MNLDKDGSLYMRLLKGSVGKKTDGTRNQIQISWFWLQVFCHIGMYDTDIMHSVHVSYMHCIVMNNYNRNSKSSYILEHMPISHWFLYQKNVEIWMSFLKNSGPNWTCMNVLNIEDKKSVLLLDVIVRDVTTIMTILNCHRIWTHPSIMLQPTDTLKQWRCSFNVEEWCHLWTKWGASWLID